MDEQLGRLIHGIEQKLSGPLAIVIVGDHGEGLGEHGEQQHGNLLYQATTHVPLLVVGPGVAAGTTDITVSTRRVFHTILDFGGVSAANSLRGKTPEIALAESMKPFLDYGWQPQVMAVEGHQKAILAGRLEVYDIVADPSETHDLAPQATISRQGRSALQEYPIPSADAAVAGASNNNLTQEERQKLASLGYVASGVGPTVRNDAPRPADMAPLYPILDKASGLFVRSEYEEAIPLLEKIQAADPYNLDAALRLASAHSALGHEQQALAAFRKAEGIAPNSSDVKTYLALHYARGTEWEKAVPMLEQLVVTYPDRVPILEALAVIRERQQRFDDALALREKIYTLRTPTAGELVKMGELAMQTGQTATAIEAFQEARIAQPATFGHDLELGVLYLDAGRLQDARAALDLVPEASRGYPMALSNGTQ